MAHLQEKWKMEEVSYRSLIYGLKLKFKRIKADLCPEKRNKHRKLLMSFEDDIQDLIDDYES